MEEKPVSTMLKGIDKPFQASLLVINNLSITWASSGVGVGPWIWSWCLRANLGVIWAWWEWWMCMHSLLLLNLNPRCYPRGLTMGRSFLSFLWKQFRLNVCPRRSWLSISYVFTRMSTFLTFCCWCIIHIHYGWICMSIQLSMLVCFQPSLGILFESLAE